MKYELIFFTKNKGKEYYYFNDFFESFKELQNILVKFSKSMLIEPGNKNYKEIIKTLFCNCSYYLALESFPKFNLGSLINYPNVDLFFTIKPSLGYQLLSESEIKQNKVEQEGEDWRILSFSEYKIKYPDNIRKQYNVIFYSLVERMSMYEASGMDFDINNPEKIDLPIDSYLYCFDCVFEQHNIKQKLYQNPLFIEIHSEDSMYFASMSGGCFNCYNCQICNKPFDDKIKENYEYFINNYCRNCYSEKKKDEKCLICCSEEMQPF